ncbi:MAG: hypothetical protein QXM68_03735 [Candidatus Aenigmatarchaeota archaeon]|nr:hypothetical protein [Candidatus Aenigmarchaeota archaeon]
MSKLTNYVFLAFLLSLSCVKAFSPYSCIDSDGDCNIALINESDSSFEAVDILTYPFGFIQADFNISLEDQEEIDDGVILVTWYSDVGYGASNIYIDYWNGSEWISCTQSMTETNIIQENECNITSLEKQKILNLKTRIRGNDLDGMPNAFLYVDSIVLKLNYSSPPLWRSQFSSSDYIYSDQSINLSAELFDDIGLSHAWLETNHSGLWQNYSFINLNGVGNTWTNASFIFSNLTSGFVSWRIHFNDTTGKQNSTNMMSFYIQFRRTPIYCTDSDGDCDVERINKTDNIFESIDIMTFPFGWIEVNLWDNDINIDKEIKESLAVIEWYTDVDFGANNINIDYWNGSEWINCQSLIASSLPTKSYCNISHINVTQFNNILIRIRGEDNDGMPNAFLYVDSIFLLANFSEDFTPPRYYLNQTNSTIAGKAVLFSLLWQDNINLTDGQWQGWLDNCTGYFVNVTPLNSFNSNGWSNFTAIINETKNCNIKWFVNASDKKGNWNNSAVLSPFEFNTTSSAYLEVKLVKPPGNFNVAQNKTFFVNATVFCREDNCGDINATIMYNVTSNYPDTPISEIYGDSPLFINEPSPHSTKYCNSLAKDDFCNITWVVNATGNIQESISIGVLFMSSELKNHTENVSLTIYECAIDIYLSWHEIEFGEIFPNTFGNEALGNSDAIYNITLSSGSCNSDVWIKSTDIYGSSIIKAENISWSLERNYSNSFRMKNDFSLLKKNVKENDIITTFYWIDSPIVYAGRYFGNITIMANETGE